MICELRNNLNLEEKAAITDIFTKEYYLSYFNGISYVSHLLLGVLQNLGVLGLLKTKYSSGDEIIAEFGLAPKTKHVLGWVLSFLSQEGLLKKSQECYFCEKTESIDLEALLQKTIELDKKIIPSARLMEYAASEYGNFFRGDKKGFEILFSQDKIALWTDYFSNDNSGYSVHNYLGAFGVLKWTAKKDNIRLLEVGGGTGGASCALIDKLKNRNLLSGISEYIFSDISPVFLRLGNRAIMSRASDDFPYSLKRIDFDRPLVEQGIKKNEVDLVYGVNTLHVAKDLAISLKNIYEVIKPGGLIILSESCRPSLDHLLSQEVIFNLLDNYVNVNLDDKLRPSPGFLDYEHWRRNLEAAGLKNIEAIFNTDGSYPSDLRPKVDVLAAVIKAEKPD